MDIELTNTDYTILTLLEEESCTQAMLVEYTGASVEQIESRLQRLITAGAIRETATTPPRYELITDPR